MKLETLTRCTCTGRQETCKATVRRRKNNVMHRSMQDLASIAFDICQGHKIQALRNGRQSAPGLPKASVCLHDDDDHEDTQAMLPADMRKSSNPHCIYLLSQTAATLAVGLTIPARNSQQLPAPSVHRSLRHIDQCRPAAPVPGLEVLRRSAKISPGRSCTLVIGSTSLWCVAMA